ncbi:MAG TPA: S8/S53 family peptidase [Actinocrinis sp.]|nr:S8/S53 family peptidase [Actinocrinis sp.]
MRLDHAARLEDLLTRRPEFVLGQGPQGQTALHRRDEVLVSVRHADDAADHAARWVAGREDHPELGVSRLSLRPKARVDVAELVAQLRGVATDRSNGPLAVGANHVLRGEGPSYEGGPFDSPVPHGPLAPPAAAAAPGQNPVTVAVLDTGIIAHPWFTDTDWYGRVQEADFDAVPDEPDFELRHQSGHGTFVAGAILRRAPHAQLLIERVLSDDGFCDELSLLHGLANVHRKSAGTGVDVINLSLGCYTLDDQPSPLLAEALARYGNRTVIIACAGNHDSSRPFWPAALKDVHAVGSLDAGGRRRAQFSNYGWWVDACAVGENVAGPFLTCRTGEGQSFTGYASWSGTSFAAPQLAGAVAEIAFSKQLSVRDAAELLLDPATTQRRSDLGVVIE